VETVQLSVAERLITPQQRAATVSTDPYGVHPSSSANALPPQVSWPKLAVWPALRLELGGQREATSTSPMNVHVRATWCGTLLSRPVSVNR
jgi:hypothetical protein